MSDNDHKLYLYDNVIDLVSTTDAFYVSNLPMNNRKLKAHKGLINTLLFNIRDRDRKLQDVSDDVLIVHVFDPMSRKRLFSKQLQPVDKGKVKLEIVPGDIINLVPGLYHGYIVREVDSDATPLYKDVDNNIRFDIEVTDQVGQDPISTQISTTFQVSGDTVISDILYGNLEQNFSHAQHTIAMYVTDFTGTLEIQGSCVSSEPTSNTEWFNIDTISVVDQTSSIVARTFIVNCNWVRVIAEQSTGTLDKVVLRN